MNIVTNSCLGGFLYRDILRTKYSNPFIWTAIRDPDFNCLFRNYSNLDFTNYEIKSSNGKVDGTYTLRIDDSVNAIYQHVIFSANDNVPRIVGNDLYFNRPYSYIVEKYEERLKRMKEEPKFVFIDLDGSKNYALTKIANERNKKVTIITIDEKFDTSEFVKVYHVEKQDWTKVSWWEYLCNRYSDMLRELVR